MAIDVHSETLVALSDFNDNWPGKRVSTQVIHRYTLRGITVHGSDVRVKLDSIRIGRIRYTSVEAIARFIAAQNPATPTKTGKGQRQRQTAAAMHELEAIGI